MKAGGEELVRLIRKLIIVKYDLGLLLEISQKILEEIWKRNVLARLAA